MSSANRKESGLSTLTLLILIILALASLRNTIAKLFIERFVGNKLGYKVILGDINIGITESEITLENLEVFEKKEPFVRLIKAPLVYADYNLVDMAKGKIHIRLLKLDLDEITILRKQGTHNIKSLKERIKELKRSLFSKERRKKSRINIERLVLSLKRIRLLDYSTPVPRGMVINVNLREKVFKNITDPKNFFEKLIEREVLKKSR